LPETAAPLAGAERNETVRKIVAAQFVSLDGVVEAPNEWMSQFMDDELGRELGSQMASRGAMLLGRRTYQEFAAVWPGRGTDDPMAAGMNNTPKYVVSTTLDRVDEWQNSTLVTGTLGDQLEKLKQEPGQDIAIIGSLTLTRSLLRDGLVDELLLLVFPIVVGAGQRLFDGYDVSLPLTLLQSQSFPTGVVKLVYGSASK
jgi:dihydrofolate reductase